MPTLESPPPARLAAVFSQNPQEIMDEWERQATELLGQLHQKKWIITDHLPELVADITSELAGGGGNNRPDRFLRDELTTHGMQSFRDGLDVGEVVAEYNVLRIAFNSVAERHGFSIGVDAVRTINLRIDRAVRSAVMAFAEQQALMRKEQEDEHLAFIAHDLRTPLNAVSLLVESLKLGMDEQSLVENGEHFEILHRNLHRLESLIAYALDTKIRASGPNASYQPVLRTFELWPVVQRLILDLKALSAQGEIHVVNAIPPTLTVFADAALITQVFQNLLVNAFKYAPRGRVTIHAQEAGGMVTCSVADDGEGIPPGLLHTVFDKLVTDPNKTGTGLGLAIVKQIVEAHGGEVRAESEYGAGATFCFTLPPAR